MSGKNPFKIIEAEHIRIYKSKGPDTPSFLDNSRASSIQTNTPSSGSPDFPSFS